MVSAPAPSGSAVEAGRLFGAEALARFYSAFAFAPAWFDGQRPSRQAEQAIGILSRADSQGLMPEDYDVRRLSASLRHVEGGIPVTPQEMAETDVALTGAMFRYLAEVHGGRVKPKDVHAHLDLAAKELDLPDVLRRAIATDRLAEVAAESAPRLPMYGRLVGALAQYRKLAAVTVERPLPVVRKLAPGMPYVALRGLRDKLVALGDLSPSASKVERYEGELVQAVKRFQGRHGLDQDGVIGYGTFEQLNTPLTQRVRQIELALERLRWVADFDSPKVVAVNIPEFRLRAFDMRAGTAHLRASMNVIVGRALDTQTPVFDEDMRYVEFSPYWNVPQSIVRGEIIPRLRRDPGYLNRQGMELVSAGRDQGASSTASADNLEALARGELRLRQRPGPGNALGDIKFVLPNNMNIYLHHTASPGLFKRSRRDLSHGCIRVEEPVKLARFVLEDQPEWTEHRLREAMRAGSPSRAYLTKPIPVVLFYMTALVEEGGRTLFLPDIYGHDRTLDQALRERVAPGRR